MPIDDPETDPDPTGQLTVSRPARVSILDHAAVAVPGIVADAGEHAARRFLELFAATIRNRNTRMAYMVAVSRFFAWCEQNQIGQLADIEPLHVAAYIEAAGKKSPLFRSAHGRTAMLTGNRMHRVDAWRMVQRRSVAAGLIVHVGNHSFRATGITAYLNAGGTLENAQAMELTKAPAPQSFMTAPATR